MVWVVWVDCDVIWVVQYLEYLYKVHIPGFEIKYEVVYFNDVLIYKLLLGI